MMERALYPANWPDLRCACMERANYKCEVWGVKQGASRKSKRTGRFYPIHLAAAHKNNDAWNPDQDLIALCQRCHLAHDARLHDERAQALRLAKQRQGVTLHTPIVYAKVYHNTGGAVQRLSGMARSYADMRQVIADHITTGEAFTIRLEINQAWWARPTTSRRRTAL
jgi:hypothetical protein